MNHKGNGGLKDLDLTYLYMKLLVHKIILVFLSEAHKFNNFICKNILTLGPTVHSIQIDATTKMLRNFSKPKYPILSMKSHQTPV